MTYNQEVGARLVAARKFREMRRDEAAKRLHIGLSTVQLHENGARGMSAEMVAKYCRLYDVRVGWLLYGTGAMERLDSEVALILSRMEDDAARETWLQMGKMLAEKSAEE